MQTRTERKQKTPSMPVTQRTVQRQLARAAVILSSAMALGYAPVLLGAGRAVGALNSLLAGAVYAALPAAMTRRRNGRGPFAKNKNIS